MGCVVYGRIHQIAEQKSGQENKHILAHYQPKRGENHADDHCARYRRHNEAADITWVFMVHSMKCIIDASDNLALGKQRIEMKGKPVKQVFEKRPCEERGNEYSSHNLPTRHQFTLETDCKKGDDDGKVKASRYQGS